MTRSGESLPGFCPNRCDSSGMCALLNSYLTSTIKGNRTVTEWDDKAMLSLQIKIMKFAILKPDVDTNANGQIIHKGWLKL